VECFARLNRKQLFKLETQKNNIIVETNNFSFLDKNISDDKTANRTIKATILISFGDYGSIEGSVVSSGCWIRINEKIYGIHLNCAFIFIVFDIFT
jgi:hypothetical protein